VQAVTGFSDILQPALRAGFLFYVDGMKTQYLAGKQYH
jgi:hypothetical protein